jgi:hypothetical protein
VVLLSASPKSSSSGTARAATVSSTSSSSAATNPGSRPADALSKTTLAGPSGSKAARTARTAAIAFCTSGWQKCASSSGCKSRV